MEVRRRSESGMREKGGRQVERNDSQQSPTFPPPNIGIEKSQRNAVPL